MKSPPIPSGLFIKNRKKLVDSMGKGSVGIIGSNKSMPRTGDLYYPFRQHSDLFYLTGINQEESVLVLASDHNKQPLQEVLFIKKPTTKSALWNGPGLTFKEAIQQSGISQVRWLDELTGFLEELIPSRAKVYSGGTLPKENLTEQFPDTILTPLSQLTTYLRMVKELEELEQMKKASGITKSAFLRVLKMMKPEIWEYEVEAEIIDEIIGNFPL
ncbi:MAG: hypothetical protein DRI70_08720 [Bacteroidetes bacterium]|nr:MAG: hypothetical protein DRI70_08720 [Bacteroidota bacterium]